MDKATQKHLLRYPNAKEILSKRSLTAKVFDNKNGTFELQAHIGHIHYKDKNDKQFKEIDTTLIATASGWEMRQASYEVELPKYADDWFTWINSFILDPRTGGEHNLPEERIRMRPVGAQHVEGVVVNDPTDPWANKKVLYANAFGQGIDLMIQARNVGFDKLVVIREKPADLSNDRQFSFEIEQADFDFKPRKKQTEKTADDIDNEAAKIVQIKAHFDGGRELEKQGKIKEAREQAKIYNSKLGELEDDLSRKVWSKKSGLKTKDSVIFGKLKKSWFRDFKVWDSGDKREPIEISLKKSGKVILLTKTIKKEFLQEAQYPVFTDDTTSYYAGSGDGYVYKGWTSGWSSTRDASSGSGYDYTAESFDSYWVQESGSATNTFKIRRWFLPIDTSGLGSGATISAATLYIYADSITTNDDDGNDFATVVQGTQASTSSLGTSDYNKAGSTEGINSGSRLDLSSGSTGWKSWALNSTGRGWISTTGYTKLALRTGWDLLNHAIAENCTSWLRARTSEYSGTSSDPYLSITYTPGEIDTDSERSIALTGVVRSDRNIALHGEAETNSERSIVITGKLASNSERSIEISSQAKTNSERAIALHGEAQSNSERAIEITGCQDTNAEREIELHGESQSDSERDFVLQGKLADLSEREFELIGKASANSERDLALHGESASNSERLIELTGKLSSNSERDFVLHGENSGDSERALEMTGEDSANSERSVVLHGESESTSEREFEMEGVPSEFEVDDERDFEMRGKLGEDDERNIALNGQNTAYNERNVVLAGISTSADERAVELRGKAQTQAERAIELAGKDGANSERQIATHGIATTESEREISLRGNLPSNSERSFGMQTQADVNSERNFEIPVEGGEVSERNIALHGIDTTNAERAIALRGKLSANSEREIALRGLLATDDERDFVLEGETSGNSERSFALHGEAFVNSEKDIDITGCQPTNSERSVALHGENTANSERGMVVGGEARENAERAIALHGENAGYSERDIALRGKQSILNSRDIVLQGKIENDSERGFEMGAALPANGEREFELVGVYLGNSERAFEIRVIARNPYCPKTSPYSPKTSPYASKVSPYKKVKEPICL